MNEQLILVRHSLPELNRAVPARDWKLSEEGRLQAQRLAESLIRYQPERVFSSPEPKALETAEIISLALQPPVFIIEDLHEHQRSQVSFLSQSEFEKVIREFFEEPDTLVFGDETANEAYERFSRAVFSAMSENKNAATVIVSHGTVISLFVSRLTGQPGFQFWSGLGMPSMILMDMRSGSLIACKNIY